MPSRIPGSPGGAATPYAHPTGSYLNTTGTFEKSLGVSLIAVQWPGPLSYVFSLMMVTAGAHSCSRGGTPKKQGAVHTKCCDRPSFSAECRTRLYLLHQLRKPEGPTSDLPQIQGWSTFSSFLILAGCPSARGSQKELSPGPSFSSPPLVR